MTKWYQIAATRITDDRIFNGKVEVNSISNVVKVLARYGLHVHRYYEVDPPEGGKDEN